MPTIGVEKEAFLAGIGRDSAKVTQEELENLFFDLGLELDDIEEEAGKVIFKIFFEKSSKSETFKFYTNFSLLIQSNTGFDYS